MSEESFGEEADKIIINYTKPDRGIREVFQAMPKEVLLFLIRLLKEVKKQGSIGVNICPTCKHLHNNGHYDYNRRMTFLMRAEQVLNGEWLTKEQFLSRS